MTHSVTLDPIKLKHRALWALGDYDRVATQVVAGLGPVLVAAARVAPGDRVLDVAAGSGNATLPAAEAGATVTALDLTPELVTIGRERSAERGLSVDWREGDAEHLPFPDGSFDVVMSCIGAMFAPFHQPVADELIRVTAPGGRLAMINWTPEGLVGHLFAALKPFAATAPAGATPPPRWGDEQHVADLFADRVTDLLFERRTLVVDRFASGAEFRDFFARNYGPTIAAYRNVADDPERAAELDRALADVGDRFGAGTGRSEWEYLLVTARRR